jgi:hypothetical protein
MNRDSQKNQDMKSRVTGSFYERALVHQALNKWCIDHKTQLNKSGVF